MLKIGLCDDDPGVLNELKVLLNGYRLQYNKELSYITFQSPFDLLAEVERGNRFDVLFLDVLMPGENGIQAAAEIRKLDHNVKIIFLTSSAEYAVQSYEVSAYYYMLKPIQKASLYKLLNNICTACEKDHTRSLILRCKEGLTRLDPCDIEYCEVIHRTLYIHLRSGKMMESIGSLDELNKYLHVWGNFLRVHRSYLVNMDYIQSLSYRAVTMKCLAEIPIPRGKYNELKNAFLEHAFQQQEVTKNE